MSTYRRLMMSKIPDNEIWYYAADKVTLYTSEGVLSHEFSDGKGVIVLSGSANTVGEQLRGTAITDVDFPSCVTKIGESAFRGCTSLALTELPSGVTEIGVYAFSGCTSLALTELPSGVTRIGYYAFYDCTSLALTELPSGVTRIEQCAFYGCTSLALTELPSGVTEIIGFAFSGCTSLALTSLPSRVTGIGERAFIGCKSITSLTIPITDPPSLGLYAFYQTSFPIYVPSESVDIYKAARNWSDFASRIFPIT